LVEQVGKQIGEGGKRRTRNRGELGEWINGSVIPLRKRKGEKKNGENCSGEKPRRGKENGKT